MSEGTGLGGLWAAPNSGRYQEDGTLSSNPPDSKAWILPTSTSNLGHLLLSLSSHMQIDEIGSIFLFPVLFSSVPLEQCSIVNLMCQLDCWILDQIISLDVSVRVFLHETNT